MLGKVNLVILEVVVMVVVQVMGNDYVIMVGGQFGNFELNVMLFVIVSNLLDSIMLLLNSLILLVDKVIKGFIVNQDNFEKVLYKNLILVIVLNFIIGYNCVVDIVKVVYKFQCLILDVVFEMIDILESELKVLLDLCKLISN